VSRGVAEDLAQRGVRSIVAPDPIIDGDFETRLRADVTLPWREDGTPLIVAATRLVAEKDVGVLIEASAQVHRHRPLHLLVLGDGPERARLEARAASVSLGADVAFAGFVPDAAPYLGRATVLAHSSRVEGLPHVLVEGLAAGASVVATDCPSGPSELLGDGRYGRLVPVGDVDAFAGALEAALDAGRQPAPPESWQRYRFVDALDQWVTLLGLR
jgi:glycosyltransferase involved in cell wall biosynthesis